MRAHHCHAPNASTSTVIDIAVGHLGRLRDRLNSSGWHTSAVVPEDRWPYVHVVNPCMRALNENIVAAPDIHGRWCFWWSWGQPIAEVTDLPQVIARLGQVLALNGRR